MDYRELCFVLSVFVVVALVLPATSDYAHEAVASFGWTPRFDKSHKLITVTVGMEFVLFSDEATIIPACAWTGKGRRDLPYVRPKSRAITG